MLSCDWTSPGMLSGRLRITRGLCSLFLFPPHSVAVLSVSPLPVSRDPELPQYLKAVVHLCVCGVSVSLPLTHVTASEPPILPLHPPPRAGNRRAWAIGLFPD